VVVIAAGVLIGINNTLTTQAVMLVSPVDRQVASAAYGFVQFVGGGARASCGRAARPKRQNGADVDCSRIGVWGTSFSAATASVGALPILRACEGTLRALEVTS
jgi:hypothetical protein